MRDLPLYQVKAKLSAIVANRETVRILRRGKPVMLMTPIEQQKEAAPVKKLLLADVARAAIEE